LKNLFRDALVRFVVALCGTPCFDRISRPTASVLLYVIGLEKESRECAVRLCDLHLAGWIRRLY